MNLAEAAQLILTLSLKDEVSSGLRGIQGALDKTNTKGASLSSSLGKIGTGVGVGIQNAAKLGVLGFGALWTQVDAGIDSLVELQDVQAQTNAVIKSTGGAAGLTAKDVRDLATQYEDLSGVDDKVIEGGEDVLLTFKNIGKDTFPAATLAALDMSQAMGQDLQSSVVQIGKALNDPIAGITALTRVGVTFTDEQKDVIQALVDTGDVAGAQKIILGELNSEFGGSAQASMEGYRGTQLRLKDTWEDLQQTLAQALLPALDTLGKKLKGFLSDPEVKDGVKKLGEAIAGLFSAENSDKAIGAVKDLFGFLRDLPWTQIKEGMSFAADNAKKVVDVFKSLPPGVQAGLLTFLAANKLSGGLIASGLGDLAKIALSSLKTITAGNVTLIAASVTGGGGGNGVPGIPGVPAAGGAAAAGLSVGTIASGVALGSVAAVAGISLISAGMNETYKRLGFTNQEIDLQNTITQLEADKSRARTKEAADAIQARIDEAKAKLATVSSLAQTQNTIASESRDRLTTLTHKQTTVEVNVNSVLKVSGQQVAQALDHYSRINDYAI